MYNWESNIKYTSIFHREYLYWTYRHSIVSGHMSKYIFIYSSHEQNHNFCTQNYTYILQ